VHSRSQPVLPEYFAIAKEAKAAGSSNTETAAVMMGHATGFNQAVETVTGETRSGAELRGIRSFATGLDALVRVASTIMTVAGGVQATVRPWVSEVQRGWCRQSTASRDAIS